MIILTKMQIVNPNSKKKPTSSLPFQRPFFRWTWASQFPHRFSSSNCWNTTTGNKRHRLFVQITGAGLFIRWMPILLPNQQYQSTQGNLKHT